MISQKQNLFKKYEDEDKAWQKWAWIIERKFSEWNLKKITESLHTIEDNRPKTEEEKLARIAEIQKKLNN